MSPTRYPLGVITLLAIDQALSSLHVQHRAYARLDVSRGLTPPLLASYDEWAATLHPPPMRCVLHARVRRPFDRFYSSHAPAYPIPTSYPRIFGPTTPESIGVFSSLTTSSRLASMFEAGARFVETCGRRHQDVVAKFGLDKDELREIRDDLWVAHDAYKEDEYVETVEVDDDE